MKQVAIIGAGLAGLAAADKLAAANFSVTVFDKSRGTGGRLATRRHPAGPFDHGAPVAQGDAAFDAEMRRLGAKPAGDGWKGQPGMSGLVKPLVKSIDLRTGTRIDGARYDNGWHLSAADGGQGPFDMLLVAIPSPQLADLFPEKDLSGVRMTARWTLMTHWPGFSPPPLGAPFEAIVAQDAADAWVAHADAEWTAAHLELAPDDVAARMVELLATASGTETRPDHVAAHRWRYARVATPLGRPFLDLGNGAFAGGDWALGPDAGHAWISGRAMADAVLSRTEGHD